MRRLIVSLGLLLLLGQAMAFAAPKKVAVLVFEGVELLDFAGPAEAFAVARSEHYEMFYDVSIVSIDGKPVTSQRILDIKPRYSIDNCPTPDIFVLPGGDVNAIAIDPRLRRKIKEWMGAGAHAFSVCNGASVLGSLGILERKPVATHRSNFEILRAIDPTVKVVDDAKIVSSKTMTTAAGISSGIDGALYLIARDHGMEVAKRAATHMEYLYWPGLKADSLAEIAPVSDGFAIQTGGTRDNGPKWRIYQLLELIAASKNPSQVVADYERLLVGAEGHDLEMIEAPALEEISLWLFGISRDRQLALRLAHFNTLVHPDRAEAHYTYGRIRSKLGDYQGALDSLKTALRLNKNLSGLTHSIQFVTSQLPQGEMTSFDQKDSSLEEK